MSYHSANRSNLYLDRKGSKDEWEPDKLDHLSNFLEKMGLISEVTSLPENLFAGLNQAVASSGFWLADNDADDTEMNNVGRGIFISQTEAAEALNDTLQDFFDAQSFPITIAVNSIDPADQKPDAKVKFPIGIDHKLYPNGLVVGAEQSIENGRFVMYIHLAPVDVSFDKSAVNPSAIAAKISRIVRHELVHTQQFEKRRRKNKTSRMAAKKAYEAEGEIPPEDAPRDQYLGAGIEIDAYAHEFAEELLDTLGSQKALDVIRTKQTAEELEQLGLSDTIIEYLSDFGDTDFTKKLRVKMYAQMRDMVSRGLYEGKNQQKFLRINGKEVVIEIADCDQSRRRGLMNRLSLDEDKGMLFVFSEEKNRSFWMKETYLPLSIAYLDKTGTVVNIEKMTPLDITGVKSLSPAKYALEMNEGWFDRNGVCIGDVIDVGDFEERVMKLTESSLRKVIRRMIRESFVSHSDEPEKGDSVVNNNPGCKHYGSEGVVLDVQHLPGDAGKVIMYRVTNMGPAFQPGDVLEKTLDQLTRKRYGPSSL